MTSTELNSQFALANALRFETAPGGLTRAVIATPLAQAEIYQQGAHIAQWAVPGRKPVLFMSSKSFLAPGKAIRGGVPIIFPWFGPRSGGQPGPAHGFARTALWSVESARLMDSGAVEIAFGLGAIIRHTAGAIATVIGLMFIIPVVIQALPDNWRQDIMRFFPDAAGRVISVTVPGGGNQHLWSSWPQMLVTACYAVGLLAIGAYMFAKRDA